MRVVVVGAGIGGLVAARLLQRAGLEVVVLEAHTYPGGLAGDFWHQGFRFPAGATLLSGFALGAPLALLEGLLGLPERVPRDAWGASALYGVLPFRAALPTTGKTPGSGPLPSSPSSRNPLPLPGRGE